MENKTIGIIISIAVALILGLVLVTILAEQTVSKTQTTTKTETLNLAPARDGTAINESYVYTLSTGVTDWRNDNDCIPSTIVYKNNTGTTATVTTDYVYTAATGSLTLKNTPLVNGTSSNASTVSYAYCPDDYITQSWQRSVINLVPGFFALALLLGVCFVIFYVLRAEGIQVEF